MRLISPTSLKRPVLEHLRLSCISLYRIQTVARPSTRLRSRAFTTSTSRHAPNFDRTDFSSQPFTGLYEAPGPTKGPLGQSSNHGVPRITPRRLKEYLDRYVIGQERAKKMLSVAVYSHYQRVQELERIQEEEAHRLAREQAKRSLREREAYHAAEEAFMSGQRITRLKAEEQDQPNPRARRYTPIQIDTPPPPDPLAESDQVTMEKSNVMVLGPTGVGKTLIVKTLAKALEVPFSMSDCTPFTQAGYIGEDAEVCVARLLAAADYDVARAEYGIICLDEVDKLAVSRSSNGRDVGGEGVQQALLKIIEGTTLTITAKNDQKSAKNSTPTAATFGGGFNANTSQLGGGNQKPDTYTIRTDNILFIFTGAFVGLQKLIMDRLSKGSMGFGASVRGSTTSNHDHQMTMSSEDAHLYFKHLPFYTDITSAPPSPLPVQSNSPITQDTTTYNPLDLCTPDDLQKFGIIPEFLGRIPVTTALSPLSIPHLFRVLTEPRNSIIAQKTLLFNTFGSELRFTTPALHEIAKQAFKLGTGARGVRTIVEELLGEAVYEVPGSSVRYVLVGEAAARRKQKVGYFSRGQGHVFRGEWEREEGEWEEKVRAQELLRTGSDREDRDFAAFRERAGSGM